MHWVSAHRPGTVRILEQVPKDGGNRPIGVGPKCLDIARERHGGYTDVYGRLAWDKPAVTLTGKCRTPSAGRYAHPAQNRGFRYERRRYCRASPRNTCSTGRSTACTSRSGMPSPLWWRKSWAEHILELLAVEQPLLGQLDRSRDIDRPVGPGFAVTIHGIKRKSRRRSQSRHE